MLAFIPPRPYILSAGILAGSLLLAHLSSYVLHRHVRRLVKRTQTTADDALLDSILLPVYAGIILAGAYSSLMIFPPAAPYHGIIRSVFFITAVLGAAWLLQRVITAVIPVWFAVGKTYEKTPKILSRVINGAFYFIALMIILDYFGVEITPLVTTLGIGGIAVGLALQDTLSNFFAGLYILSEKPFSIGDFIEVDSTISGYVDDVGWRTTKILTLAGNFVILPNSKISQSTIVNTTLPSPEVGINVPCGVSYEANLDRVERIATEAAQYVQQHTPGAVKDALPSIRFHTFGDSNILFNVGIKVERFPDKYAVTSALIKELKKRFDREGITIAYPTRRIISDTAGKGQK